MKAALLVALAGVGIAMIAYPSYSAPEPPGSYKISREIELAENAIRKYAVPARFLLTIRYTSIVYGYSDLHSCSIAASFVESNPQAVPDGMSRDVTCEEVQ